MRCDGCDREMRQAYRTHDVIVCGEVDDVFPNPERSLMLRSSDLVGTTVKLHRQRAYRMPKNEECEVSGEFTVEEFCPYEPSAYQHEAGYTMFRKDTDQEYFVPLDYPDDDS